MNKKIKLIALISLLATGYFIVKDNNHSTPVSASPGDKPTIIDATDMNDAALSSFYTGVEGLTGDDLLAFLHEKTKDHLEYNYESTSHREIYKIIERDWSLDHLSPANLTAFDYKNDNGYLRLLYGDYNGDSNTAVRFYKPGSTSSVTFDKEHIWPQSLGDFGRTGGAGSDFHALWAADPKINQHAHSNNHYAVPLLDIKDRETSYGINGGRTGRLEDKGQLVFEPNDEYKGDVARAMFYMPARYFVHQDKLHPKLELVNGTPNPVTGTTLISGKAGDLETLLEWHELDPVDEFEIHRNNLIYNNYQLNRNPFIDYPQWARIAYDSSYSGAGASNLLETSSVGLDSDPFKDATLLSISLDTTTVKTEYLKKEKFSSQGLLVTAHYSNGESRKTKNFTLNLANNTVLNTAGNMEVVVSLTHGDDTRTANFTITVDTNSLSDVLFISEVYGGGGNSGAIYTHDFIEIYNHSESKVSLSGKSIQYASAGVGSAWNGFQLSGEIAAKSYYLLKLGGTATADEILDTPQGDVSGNTNIAVANFKVALVNGSAQLAPNNVSNHADVIDFVGGGTSSEVLVTKAPSATATQSLTRKVSVEGAPSNIRNNSLDYELAAPTPSNSAISVALTIMNIGDTPNQCINQYPIFKEKVLSLSDSIYEENNDGDEVLVSHGQRHYFKTGTEPRLVQGRARYIAWATHLGDVEPYLPDNEYLEPTNNITNNSNNALIYGLIATLFISFSAFLMIKKKNRN